MILLSSSSVKVESENKVCVLRLCESRDWVSINVELSDNRNAWATVALEQLKTFVKIEEELKLSENTVTELQDETLMVWATVSVECITSQFTDDTDNNELKKLFVLMVEDSRAIVFVWDDSQES